MNRLHRVAAAGAFSLSLLAGTARAQDLKFSEAKTYFNAGAEAFDAGQFLAAVQAFEQAYRLVPKPAIVFSIAQSYRRQFYLDRKPERAKSALAFYRRYLEQVPKGGRRSDASQALVELEPFTGRADGATAAASAAPPPFDLRTRVMVSATHTVHAHISLDGGDEVDSPLIEEVTPGKHTVEVSAPGYLEEKRELVAVEGALVAVETPLREKPARLAVTGPRGAELEVDGRFAATLPLSAPLRLAPGRRWLSVTQNGHLPFSREVDMKRDQGKTITADLPTSTQRKIAYGIWMAASAAAVTGGVLGGLALSAQSDAHDVEDRRRRGNILPADADAHDRAVTRRDDFRTAAIISFSAGIALGACGLALFVWDHPPSTPPPAPDDSPIETPQAPTRPQLEVSLHPLIAPGSYGLSLNGTL